MDVQLLENFTDRVVIEKPNPSSNDPVNESELVEDMTSKDIAKDPEAAISVQHEKLICGVRLEVFRNAICSNRHLFQQKVVLEIGCDLGVFAMFAAKAGASLVFSVSPSNMVQYARRIVEANKMDAIVKVIQCKIEDFQLPENIESVDIIISDWMGSSLIFDSRIHNVIIARDKFLKPGGLIFPDSATLYMVGIQDVFHKADCIDFWDNVYEWNMSCIGDEAIKEPQFVHVRSNMMLTDPCVLMHYDLYKLQPNHLEMTKSFTMNLSRVGIMNAFCMYFDVVFTKCHNPIGFSTAPGHPHTFYKNSVYFMRNNFKINANSSLSVILRVKYSRKYDRQFDLQLDVKYRDLQCAIRETAEYSA